jgi:hypothetical protein
MSRRRRGHAPKFSLEAVQTLVRGNAYRITDVARKGAEALYLDEDDIVECVCALTADDYEQTLDSTKIPGTFQDVYSPRFHGFELYVKVRLVDGRQVVVISFKQNESP